MPAFLAAPLIALALLSTFATVVWLARQHYLGRLPSKGSSAVACVHRAIAFVPVVWVALFTAIVARARLQLGFWPYPQYVEPGRSPFDGGLHPSPLDPKEFPLHNDAVWLLAPAVWLSWIVYPPIAVFVGRYRPAGERAFVAFYFAGLAACALIWFGDPGHFFEWFID